MCPWGCCKVSRCCLHAAAWAHRQQAAGAARKPLPGAQSGLTQQGARNKGATKPQTAPPTGIGHCLPKLTSFSSIKLQPGKTKENRVREVKVIQTWIVACWLFWLSEWVMYRNGVGQRLKPSYIPDTVPCLLDTWPHFRSQKFCKRLKHSHFIQEEIEEKEGREKNGVEKEEKGERGFHEHLLRCPVLLGLFTCHHSSSLPLEGGNLTHPGLVTSRSWGHGCH